MTFELNQTEYEMNKGIEYWAKNQYEVYVGDTVKELKFNVEHENSARRGKLRSVSEDVSFPFKVIMPNGIEQFFALVYPIPVDETKVIEINKPVVTDKSVELEEEPVKLVEEEYRPCNNMAEFLQVVDKRVLKEIPPYSMPFVWVKYKASNTRNLITGYTDDGVELGATFVSWNHLFDNFTFLDIAPCGVKIN